MELILLDNFYGIIRGGTGRATSAKFVDTSGNTRSMDSYYVNPNPFRNTAPNPKGTVDTDCCLFYAVSDITIAHDAYSVTRIGTTTQYVAGTANGYANTIIITGNADATITHLVAVRKINYNSGSSAEALVFALKLDTPVQLNASNNYTAYFTVGIEF